MPQLGVAAKSYLTKQSSPPPGLDFVEPFSFVDVASLKLIGQEELYGKKCNILEGNTMGAEFSSGRQLVKLWLDISNNLLYQVKTYNHSESISITVTYNNVEINKLFNDSEFEFSPPPGTQIKER
jgi:outer membrane lipoprotein-sorting protein